MSLASAFRSRSTTTLDKVSYISAGHCRDVPVRLIGVGSNRYVEKTTKHCGISLISKSLAIL